MKIKLIVPVYKSANNLQRLCDSVISQSCDDWELIISIDACEDSYNEAKNIRARLKPLDADRIKVQLNEERKFALKNIYDCIASSNDSDEKTIYGVIDGDDELCNDNALALILSEYEKGASLAWTTYTRDDEGECVSDSLPLDADPYKYKWVSSHFRTFGNWVFTKINDANFRDPDGNFLIRAYDQCLMLPMLYYCNTNQLKTSFIPEVCYKYNHKNSSTPKLEHTNGVFEHKLSQFIRQRGYVE